MGPLLAALQKAYRVLPQAEVLPRPPLVDHIAAWGDFLDDVAQHLTLGRTVAESAVHRGGQVLRKRLPHQHQGISVGQTFKVVVQEGIAVCPNYVAVPVQLQDGPGRRSASPGQKVALRAGQKGNFLRGRPGTKQQVAVGQEIAVADAFVGMPRVADSAFHVDQFGVVPTDVGEESIATITILGSVVDQTC